MTMTTEMHTRLAARIERSISTATDLLEAGFPSEARRKVALNALNMAYNDIASIVHDQAITIARDSLADWQAVETWQQYLNELERLSVPHNLHEVRQRHFDAVSFEIPAFGQVRDLLAMRDAIKATVITPVERPLVYETVERVRRSLVEEMAARKQQYVQGLDMARHLGGLPVSVNAHWVRGHKGTDFVRHYFYLRGVLTPLNVICAIADTLAHEQKEA